MTSSKAQGIRETLDFQTPFSLNCLYIILNDFFFVMVFSSFFIPFYMLESWYYAENNPAAISFSTKSVTMFLHLGSFED